MNYYWLNCGEIVSRLTTVKQNGYALDYADDSLKADREVVLAAVKEYGRAALQYASEELQQDEELQKIAEEAEEWIFHSGDQLRTRTSRHSRKIYSFSGMLGMKHIYTVC